MASGTLGQFVKTGVKTWNSKKWEPNSGLHLILTSDCGLGRALSRPAAPPSLQPQGRLSQGTSHPQNKQWLTSYAPPALARIWPKERGEQMQSCTLRLPPASPPQTFILLFFFLLLFLSHSSFLPLFFPSFLSSSFPPFFPSFLSSFHLEHVIFQVSCINIVIPKYATLI